MKKRLAAQAADEQGTVLMLVLGFMVLVGVMIIPLANYATTSLRTTINVRDLRSVQVSAESATDGAINAVRFNQALAGSGGCFNATLNGQTVRVDCSGPTSGLTTTVTFTAWLTSVSPARQILTADASYNRTNPLAVTVALNNWSVKK